MGLQDDYMGKFYTQDNKVVGKPCVNNVLFEAALREGSCSHGMVLYITFIDLDKAFHYQSSDQSCTGLMVPL